MSRDLIIPIYVDTNALLDLLASIEGGFSVVEKVSTQETSARNTSLEANTSAGTEFGIPNVLSLLKLNLGFTGHASRASEQRQEQETERYHTYGSLFYRLREYLEDQRLIKRMNPDDESWNAIQVADFIELRGVFAPNPLTDALKFIERMIPLIELAKSLPGSSADSPVLGPTINKRQGRKKHQSTITSISPENQQLTQLRSFLRELLQGLENEQVRSFIVSSTDRDSLEAVVVLSLDYLRDKTMTEIYQKEFFLLGKVVRKVEPEEGQPISLLTGTVLGSLGDSIVHKIVDALRSMPDMNLPDIRTEIDGPALEIVPIAVYV
jgi:hypothetical protein